MFGATVATTKAFVATRNATGLFEAGASQLPPRLHALHQAARRQAWSLLVRLQRHCSISLKLGRLFKRFGESGMQHLVSD